MALTDLSNLKAPGWQRVVSELTSPAADDRVFLLRLLGVLGQVSGARQGVLFTVGGQRENAPEFEPRPTLVWPLAGDAVDAQGRVSRSLDAMFDAGAFDERQLESAAEVKAAARSAGTTRQPAVFALEGDTLMYDASGQRGSVIAAPVMAGLPAEASGLPLLGVITLLIDSRSRQALQTTLAMVEVLTGYSFLHAASQALRRARASGASLDLAARLIASINSTNDFKGCCLQLVNDLSRQLSVDRVAVGWVHEAGSAREGSSPRRETRCVALSDTENLDRRMAMVRKIEHAMDECLDQEQPVLFPAPEASGDAVLSQAVTHAHRELAAEDARLKVASMPLRVVDAEGERIVGVLLVEAGGEGKIDTATVELLQATLDLVAPVLAVRRSDDRILAARAWASAKRAAGWAVGPTHTVWKVAGVLVMAAVLFMTFYTTTYRVGAPMQLQPRERRTLSMPFDGTIARVAEGMEPGRDVRAGEVLVELDTREMILSRLEAEAQVVQFEKQEAEALKRSELSEASQARAKAEQARARRDLMTYQIERSRVISPIDGTIIAGDLRRKIGASARVGDGLLEVADTRDMVVVAEVDDRDIAMIGVGGTGQVSPKSDPSLAMDFTVEAVVPLARAKEGENVFEVRGKVQQGALPAWALPGMEGQARFDTEEHSLAWIASRRVIDTLRVWLWW
ncbi:MAG: HlyD family efflux transporter periplasmic adaptor subunit [Planctomycetota bacterium]|nr:HlyD family efflux transporter periplasmic adaptor subunit [Planctomycetota bacterium]